MSSFVVAVPHAVAEASADLSGIGSALRAAQVAAAGSTTQIVAAAGDEVSAAIAVVFGSYAQQYQVIGAQAAAFHDQFMQALSGAGEAYAATEAASVSPLQTLQDGILGIVNAPTNFLLGRPLIGDGADGTAASPDGKAGGFLYGSGGNGFS